MLVENAHMPFVVRHLDRDVLLFCRGTKETGVYGNEYPYTAWSIYWMDMQLRESHRLTTPYQDTDIECNPVAYSMGGSLVVSYSATPVPPEEPHRYSLNQLSGPSVGSLNPQEVDLGKLGLFNGFVAPCGVWLCWKNMITHVDNHSRTTVRVTTPFQFVVRVVPAGNDILITGQVEGGFDTVRYNLERNEVVGRVLCDGGPVYKCTIWNGLIIHAVRGKEFEERSLHIGEYSLQPVDMAFTVKDKEWVGTTLVEPRPVVTYVDPMADVPDWIKLLDIQGIAEYLKLTKPPHLEEGLKLIAELESKRGQDSCTECEASRLNSQARLWLTDKELS